jgi:hypothetical protein
MIKGYGAIIRSLFIGIFVGIIIFDYNLFFIFLGGI